MPFARDGQLLGLDGNLMSFGKLRATRMHTHLAHYSQAKAGIRAAARVGIEPAHGCSILSPLLSPLLPPNAAQLG